MRQNAILPALDTWLARVFAPGHLGRTVRAVCESGDMADRLQAADPEDKAPLYADFRLEPEYHADQRVVTVRPQPADMCIIACPRGELDQYPTDHAAHRRIGAGPYVVADRGRGKSRKQGLVVPDLV